MLEQFGAYVGVFKSLAIIFVYVLVFGLIGLSVFAIVLMIMWQKSKKRVIELTLNSNRMRVFSAREKKRKKGIRQLWLSKIRRYIPLVPHEKYFLNKGKDTLMLVQDKNGMYHNLVLPTYKQIKKWYSVVYDIDLENITEEEKEKVRDIYIQPEEHENLDFLADGLMETDKKWNFEHWWQHPSVMILGTAFICFLMIVMTMVLGNKLTG